MPDQESTPEPPKRMTTAEAARTAQDAMALASSVTEDAERLSEKFTELDQRVRDRETAHAELRDELMGRLSGAHPADAPTRDQVDSRIHEALQPLHDEVHELRSKGTLTPESTRSLSAVLARLEDAERKLAAVDNDGVVTRAVQEIHPLLSGLRGRLDAVESELRSQSEPVPATLAEDHLSDVVRAQVELALTDLSTTSDVSRARVDQLARDLQRVETWAQEHPQPLPILDAMDAVHGRSGTGAARKVLELMRLVTSIGKEKEANLGKGGRFKFRGIDDAMDAVGHGMREVGLIMSTEILNRETSLTPVTQQGSENGRPWERTIVWATSVVTIRYTFTDPEDGSKHVFEMVGEGRDSSDKSTSKATSMACKYGLFQALMIPVTGLDDADDAPPQTIASQAAPDTPAAQPEVATGVEQPSDQQRAQRAGEALAALRKLHLVERGQQYNRLVQIMNRASSEGLLQVTVEGSTLDAHGKAVMATMRQQADQAKSSGDHQPSPDELQRAVRDLPSSQYPPDDEAGY